MRRRKLSDMSVEQLVRLFTDLAIQQDAALLALAQSEVNRLYWKIDEIGNELKSRSGDQRSALLALLDHDNKQVQLKAAHMTLAIAPLQARAKLEEIRASGWQPQALDAGMSLRFMDRGIYKPS